MMCLVLHTTPRSLYLALAVIAGLMFADAVAQEPRAARPPHLGALVGQDADKVRRLDAEHRKQLLDGNIDFAIKTAKEIYEFRKAKQGEEHWEIVDADWEVKTAKLLAEQGDESVAAFREALRSDFTFEALMEAGNYAEALARARKVLGIYTRVLGGEHPYTARFYNNLGYSLKKQGHFDDAQEAYETALDINKRVLGPDHPHVALCLSNLGMNLSAMGKLAQANAVFTKSLDIHLRILGEDNIGTAVTYSNLGQNLSAQGKHFDARAHYEKALTILRRVAGEEHSHTLWSYSALALNMNALGQHARAQIILEKVLEVRRRVLGEDHPDTAAGYSNVGYNLKAQSKHVEAEPFFRTALEINLRVLGDNHPNTGQSYNNVATNLDDLGRWSETLELHHKGLAIRRHFYGENHSYTATSYNNIGYNLNAQEQYGDAYVYFEKALAIRRHLFGDEHITTARSYNNLGHNLCLQEKYAESRQYFQKALSIAIDTLGDEHPTTAYYYNNLARCLQAEGKYAEAWEIYRGAAKAFAAARRDVVLTGEDRSTWSTEKSPLARAASVAARLNHANDAWQSLESNLGRGLWDDIAARAAATLGAAERQTLSDAQRELLRLDQALAKKLPGDVRKRTRNARAVAAIRLGELHLGLARKHGAVEGEPMKMAGVQNAIPEYAALVAWLDSPAIGPSAADADGDHWAVVVRRRGEPTWIDLAGTGTSGAWTEDDLALAGRLRGDLRGQSDGEWRSLANKLRDQRIVPLAKALAATDDLPAVRHIVVLPSSALAGIPVEVLRTTDDRWTVSNAPSGTVYAHLVDRAKKRSSARSGGLFAAGDPVFQEPHAAEELALPPRGLLVRQVVPNSNAAEAGIVSGDVLLTYNGTKLNNSTDIEVVPEDEKSGTVAAEVWRNGQTTTRNMKPGRLGIAVAKEPAPVALREKRIIDAALLAASKRGDVILQLPASAWEVESLARNAMRVGMSVRSLLGRDASEQALYDAADSGELRRYRYIHLATHGVIDEAIPARSAVILTQTDLPDPLEAVLNDKPLFDGRVSVDEIRAWWRLDADLVTLSACQTALGKYEGGEGFVGFTQALLLSGADTVCLSLWEVDDTATALLMDRFYANLFGQREGLTKPMTKAAALAEAQSWLRQLTVAEATKRLATLTDGVSRGKGHETHVIPGPKLKSEDATSRPYEHPHYWAAFVLVGLHE